MHPRYDADRLYVSRKERGGGLARIEDRVDKSIWRLENDVKKNIERQITATRNDKKQHKNQQNNNNKKTKIGRKTTVWVFQEINKRNLTRENLDMAKKEKP